MTTRHVDQMLARPADREDAIGVEARDQPTVVAGRRERQRNGRLRERLRIEVRSERYGRDDRRDPRVMRDAIDIVAEAVADHELRD
jgi:hypothetical protein